MRKLLFILFCLCTMAVQAQETVAFRYWFDQNESAVVTGTTTVGNFHLDADVSQLPTGLHFFNYQVVSPTYDESVVHSAFFCKVPAFSNRKVRIQIDGIDVDNADMAINEALVLDMNVDSLPLGLHSLAVYITDDSGTPTQPVQSFFIKVPSDENRKGMNLYYVIDEDSAGTRYPCVYKDSIAYANVDMTALSLGNHSIKFLIIDNKGYMSETKESTFRRMPVTETVKVENIALSADTLTLTAGEKQELTATVMPINAKNKDLVWWSSDTTVAIVDTAGTVTAVGQGETVVNVRSAEVDSVTTSCAVIVKKDLTAQIRDLNDLVELAQKLCNSSTEGTNPGQYKVGSRDALLTVIKAVRERISDDMTEDDISDCRTKLQDAIDTFDDGKVPIPDPEKLDNVVYVSPTTVHSGSEDSLFVKIKNSASVQGFQFDLYLPEVMHFVANQKGKWAELTEDRTDSEMFDLFRSTLQADSALRVLGASTSGGTLEGSDGQVVKINIRIDDNVEEGEYPLIIKNAELTGNDNSTYFNAYFETTLTVENYVLGDVNGDGRISVSDVVMVANYVLDPEASSLNIKAADYNDDGRISVSDVVAIANAILNGQ